MFKGRAFKFGPLWDAEEEGTAVAIGAAPPSERLTSVEGGGERNRGLRFEGARTEPSRALLGECWADMGRVSPSWRCLIGDIWTRCAVIIAAPPAEVAAVKEPPLPPNTSPLTTRGDATRVREAVEGDVGAALALDNLRARREMALLRDTAAAENDF